jgi:ribosomal protein L29
MAIIKAKDAAKMSTEDKKTKLAELKFELIKANLTANKQNAKTKELKRAIARLLTLNKSKDLSRTK